MYGWELYEGQAETYRVLEHCNNKNTKLVLLHDEVDKHKNKNDHHINYPLLTVCNGNGGTG